MTNGASRAWIILPVMLLLWAGPCASARSAPDKPVPLHIGFGETSFLNVNMADAKVAFRVFTEKVGEAKGYDLEVVVHTYDSSERFQNAVTSGSLHLVIMPAWEYLSSGLDEYLEARFLALDSGYATREYLLLVSEDSGYESLSELQGKQLLLLENTNCEMSRQWIRTLLLDEYSIAADQFFGVMEAVSKPTRALLPVFFGQADACVVNRPVYDTMCELNPQLRRHLRSIAVSEPLIDSVTYLAYDGWEDPRYRSDLIESLETLHQDPQGQQILMLFKTERLGLFEERFMDGTRALKAKQDRLLEEMKRR